MTPKGLMLVVAPNQNSTHCIGCENLHKDIKACKGVQCLDTDNDDGKYRHLIPDPKSTTPLEELAWVATNCAASIGQVALVRINKVIKEHTT